MKHNIKFNHKENGSFFESLGVGPGKEALDRLNKKIVQAFEKTYADPELKDCMSFLAENLAEVLTVEELLFLATEELSGRIMTKEDYEHTMKVHGPMRNAGPTVEIKRKGKDELLN